MKQVKEGDEHDTKVFSAGDRDDAPGGDRKASRREACSTGKARL